MSKVIFILWIILFGPILVLKSAFSQDEANPYYEISNVFHQRANRFSCEFVQTQVDRINSESEESVQQDLKNDATELAQFSEDLEDDEQKKNIQLISQKMHDL
jgi:hypothetical protein